MFRREESYITPDFLDEFVNALNSGKVVIEDNDIYPEKHETGDIDCSTPNTLEQQESPTEEKYISDLINLDNVKHHTLNLISSGCGTGKSYFVLQRLREFYPDVKPEEIIVVTSRALAADQQARYDGVTKFKPNDDKSVVNFWNGDDRGLCAIDEETRRKIHVMTYDKFIFLLKYCADPEHEMMCNTKIVVFDECHALFSDEFIENMLAIRVWLNLTARYTDKIFFGLTATPGIVLKNQRRLGVKLNLLNSEVFMKHKAKQLICTNTDVLPRIIKGFAGKTLVMCSSFARCEELAKKIPYSFVLVSANNKDHFTSEMSWVRDVISDSSIIPDKRWVPSYPDISPDDFLYEELHDAGRWEPLKVLIATSTVREGFNLIKDSGVKNIVCCIPDDLHVIQVAGRARYDLDNLVVATTFDKRHDQKLDPYLKDQRNEFCDFMSDNNNGEPWFKRIAHIIRHGYQEIIVEKNRADNEGFKQWFEPKWLTCDGVEKRLYRKEDQDELMTKCIEFVIVDCWKSKMSYRKATKAIESLGYSVSKGKMQLDGQDVNYWVFTRDERSA